MTNLDLYWRSDRSWYHFEEIEEDFLVPVINDDAPEEAKLSYKNYLEQKKRSNEAV